jgi:imidazole glycerol-phosphate synthase subunit HisF
MHDVIRRTAERLFIPLTVGGGIRAFEDIRDTLRAGADKVSINTAAVLDPELVTRGARAFGSQCIVVAIDSKRVKDGHEVHTHAGSKPSGRDTIAWAQEAERRGAGEILLTSIDADGTTDGFDVELTRLVVEATRIPVIASGGCGTAAHIVTVLTEGKADAALAASIFHYARLTVGQVKETMRQAGVPVRL